MPYKGCSFPSPPVGIGNETLQASSGARRIEWRSMFFGFLLEAMFPQRREPL